MLYAPVLACRPMRPEEYPPERQRAWVAVLADVGQDDHEVYPDSTEGVCDSCGVTVAVGPRQREAVEAATFLGLLSHLRCMICAAEQAPPNVQVRHLGNSGLS